LDRLGLAGEIVWTVFDPAGGRVGVALRDNVGWLRESGERPEMDARTKNVLLHLQLRGASFARDLARGAGLEPAQVEAALWELFRAGQVRSEEHTSELQSRRDLVCRLLLEKKKKKKKYKISILR